MNEIKLKAKRKNTDDWLLFGITELFHGENGYFQVCVEDVGLFAIDPATIRPADDPLVSAALDMLACLKMALVTIEANGLNVPKVQEKIMRVINQAEGRNSNQCAASRPSCPEIPDKSMPICPIQPADDPRKAMLDEIREKINNLTEYKSFVRVEGDPVPTLPQIAKWCVEWILDEMEAKL